MRPVHFRLATKLDHLPLRDAFNHGEEDGLLGHLVDEKFEEQLSG